MRNLKKVLSLTLALVMLLGMMVVGAGAATEYKDADTIKNTEAVDVLTEIGVVEGTDGNFNPTKVLDRAEGAAIIYRLLTGGTVKNPSAGATGFVDVDSDANYTWAMGIIADLAQKGIISGEDPTHFNPSGELTGAAFSKMLLVALGYNAETQGYVGGGWEGNVIRDAYSRNITVSGVVMTNKITRDEAAQMAFQTLEAQMVSQRGGIQIGEVVIPGYAATELGNTNTSYYNAQDGKMQFCEVYFPNLKKADTTDSMHRTAVSWTNGKTSIGVYAAAPAYAAFATVSNNSQAKVLAAMNKKLTVGDYTSVYVNGEAKAWSVAAGDYAEVYVDSTDENKVVSINVTKRTVAQVSADPVTKTDGDDTLVRVPGVVNSFTNVKNVHGYENVSKDDVVLFYRDWKDDKAADWYIELADSFDGTLTAVSGTGADTKYTIGGEKYNKSGATNVLNSDAIDPTTFVKQSASWFTDKGGNIVWVKGEEVATEIAYVVATKAEGDWTGATGTVTGSDKNTAMLLLADGSVETVTYKGTVTPNTFVTYSVKDDVYNLTTVAGGDMKAAGDTETITITKGTPTITLGTTGGSVKTNASTVFFVRDYNSSTSLPKNSWAMYTGYANVPTMSLTAETNDGTATNHITAVAYLGANGYAKYVVVNPKAVVSGSNASTEIFYVVDDDVTTLYGADGVTGRTVRAVKLGSEEVIDLEFAPTVSTSSLDGLAEGSAYKITSTNKDGQIDAFNTTAITTGSGYVVGSATEKGVDGSVTLGGTLYGYTDETKVYYITAKGALEVKTVGELENDANDTYVAILAGTSAPDNLKIKAMFVTEVGVAQLTVSAPASAGYKKDDTPTALSISAVSPANGGSISYEWYENTTNSTTGGTKIDGETSTSYTPVVDTVGVKYYYAVAIEKVNGDVVTKKASAVASITVFPKENGDVIKTGSTAGGLSEADPKVENSGFKVVLPEGFTATAEGDGSKLETAASIDATTGDIKVTVKAQGSGTITVTVTCTATSQTKTYTQAVTVNA